MQVEALPIFSESCVGVRAFSKTEIKLGCCGAYIETYGYSESMNITKIFENGRVCDQLTEVGTWGVGGNSFCLFVAAGVQWNSVHPIVSLHKPAAP